MRLHAQSLSCGRGGVALATGLDFTVAPGQCLLLRGPNGTGKSTLLLTLAGIVTPMAGGFALEGVDPEAGPQLHYCGHRNAVKPRLTVRENLDFWGQLNGANGIAALAALEQVGLGPLAELDAGYLSAGQSRRLALARLLVSRRPLWLLDEPTAALDVEGHALVTGLIDSHLDRGGLVLAATHDPITLPDPSRLDTLTLGAQA
ncbi:heme ABC exporter ATP-binding protein CcmA [Devosia sp. A449]